VDGFELKVDHALLRAAGPPTPDSLVALFREAMRLCQEARVTKLLVDLTQLTPGPITTIHRFEFANGVAEFWDREIKLCLVLRPDQIDAEQFGRLVARSRGLRVGVVTSSNEGQRWLLDVTSH
jgi:hypothetical protein